MNVCSQSRDFDGKACVDLQALPEWLIGVGVLLVNNISRQNGILILP